MKKLILGFFSSLLALGCGFSQAAEQRDVTTFNNIVIDGTYQTTLTAGQPQTITLNGKGDLSQIVTEVKDQTLHIYNKNPAAANQEASILQINLPKLLGITLKGNNKLVAKALSEESINLTTSGTNQIELIGTANDFNLQIKDTADIDAKNLTAKSITLDAQGTAQISVHTNDELHIKADGNVMIKMYGTPQVLTTSLTGNSKLQVAN